MACIALPVSYHGEKQIAKNEAVLLTDGFDIDSIKNYKNDSLLTADPAIKQSNPKVKLVNLDEIKNLLPVINRLHVFGFGLNKAELNELDSIPVVFHPAVHPAGINTINWTNDLRQGVALKVQGAYYNPSDKLIKLTLKGLNTNVDSVIIAAHSTTTFNLTDLPKTIGPTTYRLLGIEDKDTVSNEVLPLTIQPVKPLKILFLASAPGFENKFLKNWLSDNNFSVAIRSAISKGKFTTEFINMAPITMDRLTTDLTDKFDVLISDESALHDLNANESSVLRQQVNTKGLGLIVKVDTTFNNSPWFQNGFIIKHSTTKETKPVSISIEGKKISAKQANNEVSFIDYKNGTQSLIVNEYNKELAAVNIAGAGKIVLTTLGDTYTWVLNGDKNDYTTLWALLISKSTHQIEEKVEWQINSEAFSVNQPVQLSLETSAEVNAINIDSLKLSPMQNNVLPFQWQTTYWPLISGWHSAKLSGDSSKYFYIYDNHDWLTLQKLAKLAATKSYLLTIKAVNATENVQIKKWIAIPKIYFYILLLLAYSWLWIEAKAGPASTTQNVK